MGPSPGMLQALGSGPGGGARHTAEMGLWRRSLPEWKVTWSKSGQKLL